MVIKTMNKLTREKVKNDNKKANWEMSWLFLMQ
jgi:hypothetical protein